ncbi:DNA helicase [Tanacetum coccineum]
MSEDVPSILSKTLGIPLIERYDTELEACVLCKVERILNSYSKSLPEFGLPLPPKDLLKALNNMLISLILQNSLFGGKTIMLGGDFRQKLPVKKNASKNEIISSSIAESYLWNNFKVFSLHEIKK